MRYQFDFVLLECIRYYFSGLLLFVHNDKSVSVYFTKCNALNRTELTMMRNEFCDLKIFCTKDAGHRCLRKFLFDKNGMRKPKTRMSRKKMSLKLFSKNKKNHILKLEKKRIRFPSFEKIK